MGQTTNLSKGTVPEAVVIIFSIPLFLDFGLMVLSSNGLEERQDVFSAYHDHGRSGKRGLSWHSYGKQRRLPLVET